jgi:hypothetical protein
MQMKREYYLRRLAFGNPSGERQAAIASKSASICGLKKVDNDKV